MGEKPAKKLTTYRRKRDPARTSEPFATSATKSGGRRRRRRCSSFSVTPPDASTTTSGSSETAFSRAGPSRRGCRSSQDHDIWPSTSRITRSRTRLRGRDPEGRVRSRNRGDLGSRHVRAGGREARRWPDRPAPRQACRRRCGRSFPRVSMDNDQRTGSCCGSAIEARVARGERGVRADARHAVGEVPHGHGWLYEVKWDGYRDDSPPT